MKRSIAILLMLIMMIPPMALPAEAAALVQADSVISIHTDKQMVAAGDEVTVTVDIQNITDCSTLDLGLVYDKEYLTVASAEDLSYPNVRGYFGAIMANHEGAIRAEVSEELQGRTAVILTAAHPENCLKVSEGTILSVKFTVQKDAPAPGIPLQLALSMSNMYSDKEIRHTIQVVNTHLATANPEKTVSSVALTQGPTKTRYVQGQALDLAGGRLLVTYSDQSTQEVLLSSAQVTQYGFNRLGAQTVKATYAGYEVSFEINTVANALSSISIGKVPTKIEYTPDVTKLDESGGILLLHYSGSIIKTLAMTNAAVTLSGFQPNVMGVQTIQVEYGGFQTAYDIAVVKKALSKIDVRTPMVCGTCGAEWSAFQLIRAAEDAKSEETEKIDPSTLVFYERQEYIANAENHVTCLSNTCEGTTFSTKMRTLYFLDELFDVENATLFVTYKDKTTEEMPMDLKMVKFNSSFPTTQTVEVVYGTKTALIKNVRTKKKVATEVVILQKPDKVIYVQGQLFDPTGGIIKVTYNNGVEEVLPMASEGVEFSSTDLNALGYQRIYVTYWSKKTYFDVRVIARAVEKIELDQNAPSTYVEGQSYHPNIALAVTYNDGSKETRNLSDNGVEVVGYDPNLVGDQLVKVTFGGKECFWPITVVKKVVTKLEIVGTLPTTILEGKDLKTALEGCTLTATYNDGEVEQEIKILPEMIEWNSAVGTQAVTLSYKEGTATFEIIVCQKSLIGIEVEGVEKQYLLGEPLNRSVGQITLIYDNDTKEYIEFSDENVSVQGFRSDAEGQYTVTVEYAGFRDTYIATVYMEVLSISVTPPAKTAYIEGEPLDLTDGVVHIIHSNGTDEQPLSLSMLSGYDPEQLGEQTITVSLGGATDTFTVNVRAKELVKITVSPETFDHKEWEELVIPPVEVTAWYDNNTFEPITEDIDIAVYDSYVTYTYKGKTAQLNINVIQTAPTHIGWATAPEKLTYVVGEPLLKDGSIYVYYNNPNKLDELLLTDENVVVDGDTSTVGLQTVYVQYKNLSALRYEINVVPLAVETVEITNKPEKLEYLEGQPLDLAGGTVLVTYNNKEAVPMAMTDFGITVSGYNPDQSGEQTITIDCGGKTAEFTVNVRAKTALSITVSTLPQTAYIEGKETALNLAGGKLTVHFDNDTHPELDLSVATLSGFKSEVGTHTITVEYQGLQTQFDITVSPKAITHIAIAAMPTKVMYRQGVERFDPKGGKITVYYNNDKQEELALSTATVSGFSNLFAGDVTLTATYGGKKVQFKVLILAENPFADVKVIDYFEIPVLWAVTLGLTNGTDATHFSPTANCTRGQIVTFLWRAAGEPEPQSANNPFTDVKSNQYYYKAVLWAVENGITNGMGNNQFKPDDTCTRGQVVTLLHRAKGKPAASGTIAFTDVKKGEYYYEAVLWAVQNGITTGMSATKFEPNTTCTRGQIVTFLYREYK